VQLLFPIFRSAIPCSFSPIPVARYIAEVLQFLSYPSQLSFVCLSPPTFDTIHLPAPRRGPSAGGEALSVAAAGAHFKGWWWYR